MGRNGEGQVRQGVREAQKVSERKGKRERQRDMHTQQRHIEKNLFNPFTSFMHRTCLAIICMRAAVNVFLFTSSHHVKHVPYVGSPVVMSVFTN